MFSSIVSFPVYAEGTDKTLIEDTEQRSDWQGKLYPESFIGEYEQAGENDVFTVWVWVKDKTEEYDVARMVYEETGLNAGNITSVSEEEYQAELETWTEEDEKLLSKEAPEYSKRAMLESRIQQRKTAEYLSALRRIEKEITSISNNDILKTFDLKEDEILYVSTDAPVMALSLSKSEIGRIAQYKDVNSIEHVGSLSDIKQYGSDPSEKDTYTYYFLAPSEWFDTESGALNEEIGFYGWNRDTKDAIWPGEKMMPAPEVGDNVFKVENVPSDISFIMFNTYVDAGDPPDPDLAKYDFKSVDISTKGYVRNEAYEGCPATDNFDGMIYVLDLNELYYDVWERANSYNGAWFTLDNYKNYEDYYGSYNLDQQENSYTYYFLAPDEYIGSDGSVGAYWWTPEETAEYPGVEMKRESDIGENVFSVEVPSTTTAITFNAYITPESNNSSDYDHYDTVNIDLSGYKKGSDADNGGCPYNDEIGTDNFDGWIFVINHNDPIKDLLPNYHVDQGAWFTLEDYKGSDYYKSYQFNDDKSKQEKNSDTNTYYFLAPKFWIDTAQGAENENVGVFYWEPEEVADFPGVIMTPAPEIGENIFKAEVPKETATIIFNDGYSYETSDPRYKNTITESQIVSCEGYEYDCPYDINLNCDNFDGWIFVLNFDQTTEHQMVKMKCNGAWFKLDDYKNYDEYYGSYPERKGSSEDAHAIGDIDGDGTVTSNDALDVLRISVNPDSANAEIKELADVDGDGEVTANDALEILRSSVGLSGSDKIGKPLAA